MQQKNIKMSWFTNFLGGAGYFFLHWAPVQFVCLSFLGYRLLQQRSAVLQSVAFSLALFSYSCAFFLNPVHFFYVPRSHPHYFSFLLLGSGLTLFSGVVWLITLFPKSCHSRKSRVSKLPSLPLLLFWSVAVLALYGASWKQDLAYLGDEVFHIISVQTFWVLLLELFQNPMVRLLLVLWLTLGILLFRLSFLSQRQRFFWLSMSSFLFLFFIPFWGYSDELFQMIPFLEDRVARYPAAQPFFSAFLGVFCVENWTRWIFSNEMSRLLPLLMIFFLGLSLVTDSFFKKQTQLFSVLFLLFVATTPTLLYHGTILYLELPMVFLMTFLVQHRKLFLWTEPKRIYNTPAGYFIFLLGFTKETVFPFLLLFLLLRLGCRFQRMRSRFQSKLYFWKEELLFFTAVFFPLALYLGIRMYFQARPYASEFTNWGNISLWMQCGYSLSNQFGILWAFVFFRLAVLMKQRKYFELGIFCFLFFGIVFFLLGDSSQHVGLARFNLLLLPLVLSFGQEGAIALFQKIPKMTLFFLSIAIGIHLWIAPLNLWSGDRYAWGKSDEQWYPYQTCFQEIQQTQSEATVLLGNMPMPYGTTVVTQILGWIPTRLVQQPPLVLNDPQKNLYSTLSLAQHHGFEVVLYREEKREKILPADFIFASFRLWRTYSTYTGRLYYFKKIK